MTALSNIRMGCNSVEKVLGEGVRAVDSPRVRFAARPSLLRKEGKEINAISPPLSERERGRGVSQLASRHRINTLFFALALGFLIFSPFTTQAQNLKVAIAANLQPVMKVLQKGFKAKTGISVDAISGPSGNLTTQIKNGAPFDVFLSADTAFPDELFKSGFAVNKPVVYAAGTLIICSAQKMDLGDWAKLLPGASVQKIAIGNPAIAPYGKAAQEALTKAGIYEQVQPKIVLGESITQVNTYITTGVVQAGFTTLSLVKDAANKTQLYYKIIDPKTYSPIEQGMVLIKQPKPNPGAEKFYRYILSPAAKKIFTRYGYHVN